MNRFTLSDLCVIEVSSAQVRVLINGERKITLLPSEFRELFNSVVGFRDADLRTGISPYGGTTTTRCIIDPIGYGFQFIREHLTDAQPSEDLSETFCTLSFKETAEFITIMPSIMEILLKQEIEESKLWGSDFVFNDKDLEEFETSDC